MRFWNSTLYSGVLIILILGACAPSLPSLEDSPVKPYSGELDPAQRTAQALALTYEDLQPDITDPASGEPLRSEVFGVYPARPGDLSQGNTACTGQDCYRVDIYNYATNTTISIIVNVKERKVVQSIALESVQPEVPPYMAQKAIEIASTSPDVAEALGFDPSTVDPVMFNVKTSLKNTACEL
jgi:hypothetical protein